MPLRSKLFEVVKNTKRDIDGVDLGHKKYKFNRQGIFHVRDRGEAQAIQQSVGQDGISDVLVIDVPNYDERGIRVHSMPRNWDGFRFKTKAERDAYYAKKGGKE